jgi:hypothetical protein
VFPSHDRKATEIHERYHLTRAADRRVIGRHGKFIVENNAMQEYIAQTLAGKQLPVEPFRTGSNKHDMETGIDTMAGEFAFGMWQIPSSASLTLTDQGLIDWQNGMLDYSPSAHTCDVLMASWFARMGALNDYDYGVGGGANPAASAADALVAALDSPYAASAQQAAMWAELEATEGIDLSAPVPVEDDDDDDYYGVVI